MDLHFRPISQSGSSSAPNQRSNGSMLDPNITSPGWPQGELRVMPQKKLLHVSFSKHAGLPSFQ